MLQLLLQQVAVVVVVTTVVAMVVVVRSTCVFVGVFVGGRWLCTLQIQQWAANFRYAVNKIDMLLVTVILLDKIPVIVVNRSICVLLSCKVVLLTANQHVPRARARPLPRAEAQKDKCGSSDTGDDRAQTKQQQPDLSRRAGHGASSTVGIAFWPHDA